MAVESKYYLSDRMVDYVTKNGTKGGWRSDSAILNPDICYAVASVWKSGQRMSVQTYVSDDRIKRSAEQIRKELGL